MRRISELDQRKDALKNVLRDLSRLYNALLKMEAVGVQPEIPEVRPLIEGRFDEEEIVRALIVQTNESLSKVKIAHAGLVLAAPEKSREALLQSMGNTLVRIESVVQSLNNALMVVPSSLLREKQVISFVLRFTGLSRLMAELDFIKDNL